MKRFWRGLLFAVVLSVLMSGIIGCGGKRENPFLGKWIAVSVTENNETIDVATNPLVDYRLEVKQERQAQITMFGEPMPATWKQENDDIIVQTVGVDMRLQFKDGKIHAQMGGQPFAIFVKEDTAEGRAAITALAKLKDNYADPETEIPTETTTAETTSAAPTTKAAETSEAGSGSLEDQWLDDWYGMMFITSAEGDYADINNETFDIWASTFIDSGTDRPTFEIYLDEEENDIYLSMYMDLYPAYIMANIGEDDAWIDERDLTAEDAASFVMTEADGFMMLAYDYVSPDKPEDKYTMSFMIRRYGDRWEGRTNLPPGFDAYIAGLGDAAEESGDDSPAATAAQASDGSVLSLLEKAAFTKGAKEYSKDGLTLMLPEGSTAEDGYFGGTTVKLGQIEGWDFTYNVKKESFYSSIEEEKKTFESIYKEAEGFEMFDMKYNDAPAVVVVSGNDGLFEGSLMIFVYTAEDERVSISCSLLAGDLDKDILSNQDLLASMMSVKW